MKQQYDKTVIFEQSKKLIEIHTLFWVEDIVAFLPIQKTTFYKYFPAGSEEMNVLKSGLAVNKIKLKVSMRSKWHKSEAPALQLALMKLIANEDELKRLSVTYNDHTTNGESIGSVIVSKESAANIDKALEEDC